MTDTLKKLKEYQREKINGFFENFFAKGLKTTQLEVDTDEKTLRPIARLKEPRDLFALPGDKQNECPLQAPRWPIECQVMKERIHHIYNVPKEPEPFYKPTGEELKPRPVGEENGLVVFNYNPVSAVNYDKKKSKKQDSSDSDSSYSESKVSTPKVKRIERRKIKLKSRFENHFDYKETSSSSSNEDGDEDDDVVKKVLNTSSNSSKNSDYVTAESSFDCSNLSQNSKSAQQINDNSDKQINQVFNNVNWKKIETSLKSIAQNNDNKNDKQEPSSVKNNAKIDKKEQQEEISPSPPPPSSNSKKSAYNLDDNLIPSVQFSRSCVGGSKTSTNVHPCNKFDYNGLEFESRFESGNLAKAVQITPTYYELYLRSDLYTCRSRQWFYFRVRNTRKDIQYRFSIVNLVKSDSLYNNGMRPLMYSETNAKKLNEGWVRCGDNICYYRNDDESGSEDEDEYATYTLTFHIKFPHNHDTVFFAHSYPYTYSELQDYLMDIQRHPVKSKFCKLRLLCRTLAGNNVYYLTVTAPKRNEDAKKQCVVVSARVHPSETPASWMMKGLMDFITSESAVAKRLRNKFIFKLIPMLNPDGVIVGNTRNSLTGKDLNRQYRTVIREAYPSIWYTKAMIKRLIDECGVVMYCDMHAHSRRNDIFIYGCENKRNADKRLSEQVFPLMMHKNVADKFSFEACRFRVQRSKEGTGRIVVWMLGITNSYTLEASFGGSSLGSRKDTHFNTGDYEHMGRAFCETLLDYCDETPNKECLRLKIIERLLKEGSSADEPLNIRLSDYSSDEGDSSTASENEGKDNGDFSDLEGSCSQSLKAPPCSPEPVASEERKRKYKRMMKIMRFLDRVYFQRLVKKKRLRQMRADSDDSNGNRKKKRKNKTKNVPSEPSIDEISPKRNLRVPRILRVFLETQNIVITRKQKRKNAKKPFARLKILPINRIHDRTVLDIPATDPTPEMHFSTDDEVYIEAPDGHSVTTFVRHSLLQSDLQRRYIIGGKYANNSCDDFKIMIRRMAPELIVTMPKGGEDDCDSSVCIKRSISTTGVCATLKGICCRRTNSLHSLKNSEKCSNSSKLRLSDTNNSPIVPERQVCVYTTAVEMPPISQNKSNDDASCNLFPAKKSLPDDDHSAVLAACSEKLVAWKRELNIEERQQENLELPTEQKFLNIKVKTKKRLDEISIKLESDLDGKIKQKRSSLVRIAETTSILTRLAKSKARSAFCNTSSGVIAIHAPTSKARTSGGATCFPSALDHQPKKSTLHFCKLKPIMNVSGNISAKKERKNFMNSNKMNANALVATCIQPRRTTKRLPTTTKSQSGNVTTTTTVITEGTESKALREDGGGETEIPKAAARPTLARKLKSKVRKKKFVTIAGKAATSFVSEKNC